MPSTLEFIARYHFTTLACAIVLFFGCSSQQKAFPDCNCTRQKGLINEVSIHTLQSARFSKSQMIEYMRGKCLVVDNPPTAFAGHITFSPVLICGIPGKLSTEDPDSLPNRVQRNYFFKTNLDFIDSTWKKTGATIPASITTNDALRDTLIHRIHTFGGPDNDSVALYWHGIFVDRLSKKYYNGGVDFGFMTQPNGSISYRAEMIRKPVRDCLQNPNQAI